MSGAGLLTFRSLTVRNRAGFTLVEMMLSVVISVMVFSAMGVLLVKTLRLWGEGSGQFHLASTARAARARLMSGGMSPGTGILSITNINSVSMGSSWGVLKYKTAAHSENFMIKGSVNEDAPANNSIFIKNISDGEKTWLTKVGDRRWGVHLPDVKANALNVVQGDKTLSIYYILSWEFGGKTYEYPQVLQAYLVNE